VAGGSGLRLAAASLLGEGRTCDVANESLELRSVPTLDPLLGVHIDAVHFGEETAHRAPGSRKSDLQLSYYGSMVPVCQEEILP
jgi:hypothetical protein